MSAVDFVSDFYGNIDIFALILVRMLAFFLLLPIISGQYVPAIAKIGFAFYTALIAVTTGQFAHPVIDGGGAFGYFLAIAGEFAVGLILSFSVYLIFSAFQFAGQLIDFQIGFSMVSVYDPVSQIQVPITGNFYYLVAAVMFLQLGGLNAFINAVFASYQSVPIGGAFIIGNGGLSVLILRMLADMCVIGFKIALPVVGALVVVDVALGLLVKAVPQMNIFVVGMPIKLLIGLLVLVTVAPLFSSYYGYVFNAAVKYATQLIRGMSP